MSLRTWSVKESSSDPSLSCSFLICFSLFCLFFLFLLVVFPIPYFFHQVFTNLVSKGIHSAFKNLSSCYPLRDHRLLLRLEHILSALAYWCPFLSEVSFLPSLVFPFVRIFESDELSCFETFVTFLFNWCWSWFEFYPNPPLRTLLAPLEATLKNLSSTLLTYLSAHDINLGVDIFWPLLVSLMTDVLSKDEWLRTFDHIMANEPSFYLYVICAYVLLLKNSLMTVQNKMEVKELLRFVIIIHHQCITIIITHTPTFKERSSQREEGEKGRASQQKQ